jgi:hypothetical protein
MSGFTNATEAAVLDCYFNQTNITAPTAIYMGLFSSNPDDAGASGTELSGNNYSRVNVTSSFSAASGGACTNDAAVDFPIASGVWSAVTGFGFWIVSTAGTAFFWDTCTLGALASNQFHRFAIGDIDIALD